MIDLGPLGDAGVLLAGVCVAVYVARDVRRRRRPQRSPLDVAPSQRAGYHPIRVKQVYQRARTGTKAIVVWQETGQRQDTWFEGTWPRQGSRLYVRGKVGYGPHNHNPSVLYLHPSDIINP